MPHLILFLARHALTGFAVAAFFVAAVVGFDVAGVGSMMARSEHGFLLAALLFFKLGLTFASVQMGVAVFALKDEDKN